MFAFHFLLQHREDIARKVNQLPSGVETDKDFDPKNRQYNFQ